LGKGHFEILRWYEDEGIFGWKREGRRPDFQRMLQDAKKLRVQAILCDNIDRFSRASVDEVQLDSNELRRYGVRWIVTASHDQYYLGKKHDIGEILRFVVAVCFACEYIRQLSRRITLAQRNGTEKGIRTGGAAPYRMADDGNVGLKFGDQKEIKIVRQIFNWFVNELS